MNDMILKPTTIQQLEKHMEYKKQQLDKNSDDYKYFEEFESWFYQNKDKIKILLKKGQYFKCYYNKDKMFSIQVWECKDEYDIVSYIALTNYIDEFCNDKTIVTK